MRILGIETSCDETGIAIYDASQGLLAHAIYSQYLIHRPFGGVIPELASRDHIKKIFPLIAQVMDKAQCTEKNLDGIAYTKGPGLAGALLIGAMVAKTLGFAWAKPTIGVHHLEGHLLAPYLEPHPPHFPHVALLVSGGHTELIIVQRLGHYQVIGDTLDDAVGEAFDKTGKLLGLDYPAGCALEKLAKHGDPGRFYFPRPMTNRPGLQFSFSGLKTFAMQTVNKHTLNGEKALDEQTKADIARAFQDAVVDTLTLKCARALHQTGLKQLVVAGGVSANLALRASLQEMCQQHEVLVYFPRLEFCTDNGAMIAYAGCQHLLLREREDFEAKVFLREEEDFGVSVLPRWSLNDLSV